MRQAKRDQKIPKRNQSINTKKQDQINPGRRGTGAPGKIYKFKDADGKEVIILDDYEGHIFEDWITKSF